MALGGGGHRVRSALTRAARPDWRGLIDATGADTPARASVELALDPSAPS